MTKQVRLWRLLTTSFSLLDTEAEGVAGAVLAEKTTWQGLENLCWWTPEATEGLWNNPLTTNFFSLKSTAWEAFILQIRCTTTFLEVQASEALNAALTLVLVPQGIFTNFFDIAETVLLDVGV